jgi:hypothetical protein
MRLVRLAAAAFLLALPSAAQAGSAKPPLNPQGLKPFLVSVTEPQAHAFSRTPSFVWNPVRNAAAYEFELSTSPSFNEGSIVWSSSALRSPAVSISAALPWMTGNPYALWAHVRALSPTGATSDWSAPYGLNMAPLAKPAKLPGTEYPGLVQWTMVDGASSYDVWFPDVHKIVRTRTNAADERELYTFHQQSPWPDVVHWRVRAVRKTYGSLPNLLPTVSYGPWSDLQTSVNPPFQTGPLTDVAATSDATSDANDTAPHRLTPGFVFGGNESLEGKSALLYRVYVFSDSQCVNVVMKGALVGSPAWAPRMTGPLALPGDSGNLYLASNGYLKDGLEGNTFMADSSKILTTELDKPFASPAEPGGDTTPNPAGTPPPAEATGSLPSTPTETGAPIDLWDNGWPNGRYYWTVVPVEPRLVASIATYLAAPISAGASTIAVNDTAGFQLNTFIQVGTGSTSEVVQIRALTPTSMTFTAPLQLAHPLRERVAAATTQVEYHELEMPQDACEQGRVQSFGKISEPAVTGAAAPYATGLSADGKLVRTPSSRQTFYGIPLVAWKPALGADQYQVQWSPTRYPWRPVDPVSKSRYERFTYATSTLLDRAVTTADGPGRGPLTPGTWYYRVRGVDFALPGTARAMSWSDPVMVRIAKPTFTVAKR